MPEYGIEPSPDGMLPWSWAAERLARSRNYWVATTRPNGRPHDYRLQGLTVVPQDRFNRPGRINVPRAPIATVPPVLAHNLPAGAPPAPLAQAGFQHQPQHDGQPGRVIGNVPPGRYTLRARGTDSDPPLYATVPVTVASGDVADISVILNPGDWVEV